MNDTNLIGNLWLDYKVVNFNPRKSLFTIQGKKFRIFKNCRSMYKFLKFRYKLKILLNRFKIIV